MNGHAAADERTAQRLQAFVSKLMYRHQESDGDTVSTSEMFFLDNFLFQAEEQLKQFKASDEIRNEGK